MTFGSWKDVPVKDVSTTPGLAGASASEAGVSVRIGGKDRRASRLTPYLFLFIPLLLLIVFTYVPIANMISYSFVKWDGLSPVKRFIGLDNYVEVFTRPELFGVFFTSVYYFIGAFVQMAIALYLATMLSFKIRFRNLFKGVIFFPYLINGVAISPGLALGQKAQVGDLGGDEEHGAGVLARRYTGATANTSGGIKCFVSYFLRNRYFICVGYTASINRNIPPSLLNSFESGPIYNQVSYYGKSFRAPGLNNNFIAVIEASHMKLAGRGLQRSVRPAIDV
jgi:hypothetical protein